MKNLSIGSHEYAQSLADTMSHVSFSSDWWREHYLGVMQSAVEWDELARRYPTPDLKVALVQFQKREDEEWKKLKDDEMEWEAQIEREGELEEQV